MRNAFLALILALLPAAVQAKEYTAERFDSRIEVLKDGSLRVTETVVIRFEEGTFTFFYRTIPTRRTDGIDFVSASMDGRALPRGEDAGQVEVRRDNGMRVEWHFEKTPPSTHTFELVYIAKGVAWSSADGDVVAWKALPTEHDYRIEASRINLLLPAAPLSPPRVSNRRVETLAQGYGDGRLEVLADKVGKNGWIEIAVTLPGGSVVAARPAWQERQLRHQQYATPAFIAAGLVMVAGLIVLFAVRQNYDAPPRDIQSPRTFSGPPDTAPSAIAGALTANGSVHLEHAMGTLFTLASDGVLTIHEGPRSWGTRQFTIERGQPRRRLAPHEQTLVDLIFSARGATERTVPLSKARGHLHSHLSKFRDAVEQEMRDAGLFDEGRRRVRRRYMLVGGLFLALALVALVPAILLVDRMGGWPFLVPAALGVLGIVSFIFTAAHTPLSNEGVRRAEAWRAYRKQLRELPKDLTRADWGRHHSPSDLLPFAVALGLAAAWSKIFKDRAAQLPSWFHAASAADANGGFVAFVGHGGAGASGGAAGGGAAGGGGSGAG